jgi:hypothetical protein
MLEKLSAMETGWTTELVRERDRRMDADEELSQINPKNDPRTTMF